MKYIISEFKNRKLVAVILILALVLRFSVVFAAYHGDLNNNISWGKIANDRGLNGFYGSDKAEDWPYSAPNQPPLTILTFSVLRSAYVGLEGIINDLNSSIGIFPSKLVWFWEERGMILLIKLPSILADIAIGILIFRFLAKKYDPKKALLGMVVWCFNPITWYNSSIWGQTDPIVNLLGFISILYLLDRKLTRSVVFLTLSFLFKGSLLVFLPVYVLTVIVKRFRIGEIVTSLLLSLATVVAVSIWFHPYADLPLWFFDLYTERILPGEIGYLTAGAFNLWWLVDPGKVYDSQMFFGISSRIIAISITILLFVVIGKKYVGSKKYEEQIWSALALSAMTAFLFMTRMHGRYLYPVFIPLTILAVKDARYVFAAAILSLTFLLNMYWGFWYPPIGLLENLLTRGDLANCLAVVNISIFTYLTKSYLFSQKASRS